MVSKYGTVGQRRFSAPRQDVFGPLVSGTRAIGPRFTTGSQVPYEFFFGKWRFPSQGRKGRETTRAKRIEESIPHESGKAWNGKSLVSTTVSSSVESAKLMTQIVVRIC